MFYCSQSLTFGIKPRRTLNNTGKTSEASAACGADDGRVIPQSLERFRHEVCTYYLLASIL